jgi:hypothetical protein
MASAPPTGVRERKKHLPCLASARSKLCPGNGGQTHYLARGPWRHHQRLTEVLKPRHADCMIAGATIVAVEQQKIFDRPVYNNGYDTWCPGNSFTDFIVADWTVRRKPGYTQKNNILTCYTPLDAKDRAGLLTEEGAREIAGNVLKDFQKLLPGSNVDPLEVHIYRRGHSLYMSTPGNFTQVLPLVRRPMERIFFANTDSEGPESTTSGYCCRGACHTRGRRRNRGERLEENGKNGCGFTRSPGLLAPLRRQFCRHLSFTDGNA